MLQVLVVIPTEDRHRTLLQRSAPDAQFTFTTISQVTRQQAQSADIILGNVPASMIAGSEKLKWLQLNSAGTDGYTARGVLPEGSVLTNASGAYGLAISEHMLGALLCIMKKLDKYSANQRDHVWQDEGQVTSIYGSKTLIVGFGNLGSEFAVRMHALGSIVTGIRRSQSEKPAYLSALYQMDALQDCLKEADIVASFLPNTPQTRYLFNEDTFSMMKPGAYFLNAGRGNAVDSDALAHALNSGHLAGAAIDVTDPEPLPADHPLWDARNLLITPHISGQYHLKETHERIISIAAKNLEAFVNGKPLCNIVDFSTGYRIPKSSV